MHTNIYRQVQVCTHTVHPYNVRILLISNARRPENTAKYCLLFLHSCLLIPQPRRLCLCLHTFVAWFVCLQDCSKGHSGTQRWQGAQHCCQGLSELSKVVRMGQMQRKIGLFGLGGGMSCINCPSSFLYSFHLCSPSLSNTQVEVQKIRRCNSSVRLIYF